MVISSYLFIHVQKVQNKQLVKVGRFLHLRLGLLEEGTEKKNGDDETYMSKAGDS